MERKLLYEIMGRSVYYDSQIKGYGFDLFRLRQEPQMSCISEILHRSASDNNVYYLLLPDQKEPSAKSVCICLLNKYYSYKIEESIDLDGTTYLITHVYLKCAGWDIKLSKNVREVIIDRRLKDCYNQKQRFDFGKSAGSSFGVDKANPYLYCSENGSLYSKDKKKLYFLNTKEEGNIIVSEQKVETICTGAIYDPSCLSIVFNGTVKEIEEDAIDNATKKNFFINNAASQIKIGKDDIMNLLGVSVRNYTNNVFFSKPNVNGRLLDSKNIELHKIILAEEALERRMNGHEASCCDYDMVYLITAPIVKYTSNLKETDGNGIVLYFESCEIPYYPGSAEGTKIYYYTNGSRSENCITVYETYNEVKELLDKANTK